MKNKYQIIYWRDIPSQIRARAGRKRISKPLDSRFLTMIDNAAMRAGITEFDDYLAEWRSTEWQPIEGEPQQFVDTLVEQLETEFPPKRLRTLSKNHGWEPDSKWADGEEE